jgi:hypothetical protein
LFAAMLRALARGILIAADLVGASGRIILGRVADAFDRAGTRWRWPVRCWPCSMLTGTA